MGALAKVELHCHMDGILDPGMLRDLRRSDPAFPILPEEFERAYPITDIQSFFGWWNFIRPIEGALTYYYPILGKHIERLKAQQVRYAEVMIAAGELPPDSGEAVESVRAFRDWVNRQAAGDIQIEFLVAIGRHRTPEAAQKLAGCILALRQAALIVGVALAGPGTSVSTSASTPTTPGPLNAAWHRNVIC